MMENQKPILVRQSFSLLFLLISQFCFANMASPITKGTSSSSAFSSRNIDILKETIFIKLNPGFKTAAFKVEYSIQCAADGQQIPLLFLAQEYRGDFGVWVDGQKVTVQGVPAKYDLNAGSPFFNFNQAFPNQVTSNEATSITIHWDEHGGSLYQLRDLKYFETSLRKGAHHIRVEYVANVWLDRSNWVKTYSLRYALSPAKHWKSFGSLAVTLDASNFQKALQSNLGKPQLGRIDAIAQWTFSELPADYLHFTYTPTISTLAQILIQIGPDCLAIAFGLLILVLHLLLLFRYKRKNPEQKLTWLVVLGVVFVPLLSLLAYLYAFGLIDQVIGSEASRFHGYTFLALLIYPVLMVGYWLVLKGVLRLVKV